MNAPASDPHHHPVQIHPHRETPERCSVRAERRADPMLGTAFPASRLLLVEQPGPWGRQGLTESHFDPTVAQRLVDGFGLLGYRVLVIRRPGRTDPTARRQWALIDCRPGHEHMVWGHYRRDGDLLDLPLDAFDSPPEPSPEQVYLVCAHGSHDACCALRGRPIAAALRELRPDQTWECSHVGGDRFAANVLVLPAGMLYGSVHPAEVADLVAASERGEVLPAPLRGRVGLVPEAQAALAQVQRTWGGRSADYRIRSVRRVDAASAVARIALLGGGGAREAEVTVEIQRSPVHRLTCQMTEPTTVLTYHPGTVTELSPSQR